MFGPTGRPGDLDGRGAPRWRQRALYDALKDTTPSTSLGLKVARGSVHDTVVDGAQLWDALDSGLPASAATVRALVEARTAEP